MTTETTSPAPIHDAGVSAERARAVGEFIAGARALARAGESAALGTIAERLVQLGQRRELFPEHHFPVSKERPNSVYRLAEDPDGGFALFVSAGLAGKYQPPHDHTTWAMIAGIRGNERNVVYRRRATDDALRDRLEHTRTVDVTAGQHVILASDDVHTIELVGGENGLHLHFYGLSLERLTKRVVFESSEGGTYRQFSPPALIRHPVIAPQALKQALVSGREVALLDVREEGVFAKKHLLLASNAPLWRLEVVIDALVPRRTTPIVVTDLDEHLAHQAAGKLARLGYRDVSVLAGGTLAWEAAGYEVYSGTNVPSKALGEVIETSLHTPTIDAAELQRGLAEGQDLVVVDSRTPEEFQAFSVPGAHSVPGAELVYRIRELAPDPSTRVVVNCAGRTRSIIGAQTLINAGIPNPVASLKDGTMAWLLGGRELAHGRAALNPEPSADSLTVARRQAEAVAARTAVQRIDADLLARFESEADEVTLYKFDIRTSAEYQAGHLPGWRWAPGGQLVQATDEYIGTRHARVVIADWDGVRALTTAAWLVQLGGYQVYVHAPAPGTPLEVGPEPRRILASSDATAEWIGVSALAEATRASSAAPVVFDVDSSLAFARAHVSGARFCAPDRLPEFVGALSPDQPVVITSGDGVLARAVAAELGRRTGRQVAALLGGTQAWRQAGQPLVPGREAILTGDDDAWYSPYAYEDKAEREAQMRAYLSWELGLVAQLERDDHFINPIPMGANGKEQP
jgi:rhodanese-related sulfurtransferase/predicted metal-dependent enzyme (double-stranded beta helix superfamily)